MTVFRLRRAAAIRMLTGTVASISLAGLVWAQAPADSWPFDEQHPAPPKSAVQKRLEELYRRDGRPLPDYMRQDSSGDEQAPSMPEQPSTEAPMQRNQRGGAASQGAVRQQLSDYYQSQGKSAPSPQAAAGSSSSPNNKPYARPAQANAKQPAPAHWYDRVNPFHRSTQNAQPQSYVQQPSSMSTAANSANRVAPAEHSATAQPEGGQVNQAAVAQSPGYSAPAPVAKPSSFWGDLGARRVPQGPAVNQSPAPIWVELGQGGKLVKKTKPLVPTAPAAVAQNEPRPAQAAVVTPAVVAPAVVAPAVVAVPVEPQQPSTQKVAAADAVSEAGDVAMPFRPSSEAEADQMENGPYTGLTLEDEQGQLAPPKAENPHHAEPAKIAHSTSRSVDSPKQSDHRSGEAAGHVSLPSAEDTGHVSVSQSEAAGHVSLPPSEEAGHVSIPQSPDSEPAGPTLPQPEPQSTPSAKPQTHHSQSTAEKQRMIGERVGRRGLKGFCPVVLRDQRELVDDNPGYCSVYHGQRFCFSSSEAQARFDAAPQKYAPAAAGLDIVVKANSDQSVEGSLDFALWYKDRLYLFCSPESLQAFSSNPTAYAVAAQRMQ
jgi:YHS domain-containing protein